MGSMFLFLKEKDLFLRVFYFLKKAFFAIKLFFFNMKQASL